MSFKSWITGVLSSVLNFLLPLMLSKGREVLADKEVQALAFEAVKIVATRCSANKDDDKFAVAVMDFRSAAVAKGRSIGLGLASVIVEAAYRKLAAEDPQSIGKPATPDSNASN